MAYYEQTPTRTIGVGDTVIIDGNTVLIDTVPVYHVGDLVTVLDHMNPCRRYGNMVARVIV